MSQPNPSSPAWRSNTKLVVALTIVAIAAAFLVRFQFILGPLIIAFILAYLLQPAAAFISRSVRVSWRASVSLLYLFMLMLLLGLLTAGGVGLVQQIQSLITLLQSSLDQLPELISVIAAQAARFGIDLQALDISSISDQLLSFGQSLLSRTGTIISSLASQAASVVGWSLFVLLVSYFILIESGGLRERLIQVDIPGYTADLSRLGRELSRIWNAFLRGQVIVFFATVIIYTIVLSILGVRYAIGLALMAGLARFVPYVGPAINWTALGLVTFFQPHKLFDMPPLTFMLVVIVIALIIDQIFDNVVSPRIMADALRVHPAGVLVAAIVAANLLGVLGVVIAAPMLATFKLLWQYVSRKMLDQDPWPEVEETGPPPGPTLLQRLLGWLKSLRGKQRKS